VCEHINTSKDLWYRELTSPLPPPPPPRPLLPSYLLLSFMAGKSERGKKNGETRGEPKRGSLRHTARSRTFAQRPLEQMDSISYFVTPPLRGRARFHGHPRTCDLFRRHISRLNAPPPLRAQLERALLFPFFIRPSSSRDPRCSSTPSAVPSSLLPISARFKT